MTATGVVVVTYNSADVIGDCLDACIKQGMHVVVVDNASTDATVAVARTRPEVTVVANPANRGFAAAVNQGIRCTEGPVVLVLNPDAAPTSGIGLLSEGAAASGVGAAAGRLVGSDGETQHGFNVRNFPTPATLAFEALGLNRLWPGNPVNRRYRQHLSPGEPVEVEQPAAAFLMINREAWAAIGGFDEGFYPVWFEDVDFCKRLHERGYRILYVPGVTARHVGGHSAANLPWGTRQVFWYGSLLRYAAKHFQRGPRIAVCLAVIVASMGRMIHGCTVRASWEPVSVYSRVIWLACSCCVMGGRIGTGEGWPSNLKENRQFSGKP